MLRRQKEKEEWRVYLEEQVKTRHAQKKREFELKNLLDLKEEKRMYTI